MFHWNLQQNSILLQLAHITNSSVTWRWYSCPVFLCDKGHHSIPIRFKNKTENPKERQNGRSMWCIYNYCFRHLSLNMSVTVKNTYTFPCCFQSVLDLHSLLNKVILCIIMIRGYFTHFFPSTIGVHIFKQQFEEFHFSPAQIIQLQELWQRKWLSKLCLNLIIVMPVPVQSSWSCHC